jgi:hypothetical protein
MVTTDKKIVSAKSAKTAATAVVRAKITPTPVAPATMAKVAPKPSAKPIAMPKTEKPAKVKKPKLVRDSFTIPKTEYTVLDELKQRAGKLGRPIKKSELLRAGIKALAAMSEGAFLTALQSVPTIKTGRPGKD